MGSARPRTHARRFGSAATDATPADAPGDTMVN